MFDLIDWSAGMQDREQLAERVAQLEAENDGLRRRLRGVGAMCINASAFPHRLVEIDEHGAVLLVQPVSEADGVFDAEDVAGLDRQVAQQV